MVKIIKHGNKKQTTCKECGCVFTYEKEDTVTEQYSMNEYVTIVECPDCKCECDVGR